MTPAIKLLQQTATTHEVVSYEHDPSSTAYGLEAAESLDLDPRLVFKTLLADLDGTTDRPRDATVVAVLPVDRMLDLKALAKAAGAKKATMADPTAAERLTGYVVGGISPLGQKKRLATFIDSSARDHRSIHVSAGRRGLEVNLDPDDLAALLDASFHPIGRPV